MIRHRPYLEIPWDMQWQAGVQPAHHRLQWLILSVTLLYLFLIGVGMLSGG